MQLSDFDRHRVRGMVLAGLLLFPLSSTAFAAEQPASKVAIIRAWKTRQQRVKSFRFVWTKNVIKTKEWNAEKAARFRRRLQQEQDETAKQRSGPTEDVEFEQRRILTVAADKTRLMDDGFSQVGGSNELWPTVITSVFDNSKRTSLGTRKGPSGEIVPQASISKVNSEMEDSDVKPLLWCYRMFAPSMQLSFRPERLEVTGEMAVIQGKRCVRLRDGPVSLYVDPTRDFLPLRFIVYRADRERISVQMDVRYIDGGHHGWVPSAWSFVYQSPQGEPRVLFTSTVNEYEINQPVSDSEFTLAIPVDTLVIDSRDPEDPVTYVQRVGGRLHVVPRSANTYQDALTSARKAEEPNKFNALFVLTNIAVLLLIAACLVVRAFRRRSDSRK